MADDKVEYTLIGVDCPPVMVDQAENDRLVGVYGTTAAVQSLRRLVKQLMEERGQDARAAEEVYKDFVKLDNTLNEVAKVLDAMRDCNDCTEWAAKVGATPFCTRHALKLGGLIGERIVALQGEEEPHLKDILGPEAWAEHLAEMRAILGGEDK